jgi:hypothetical protein
MEVGTSTALWNASGPLWSGDRALGKSFLWSPHSVPSINSAEDWMPNNPQAAAEAVEFPHDDPYARPERFHIASDNGRYREGRNSQMRFVQPASNRRPTSHPPWRIQPGGTPTEPAYDRRPCGSGAFPCLIHVACTHKNPAVRQAGHVLAGSVQRSARAGVFRRTVEAVA